MGHWDDHLDRCRDVDDSRLQNLALDTDTDASKVLALHKMGDRTSQVLYEFGQVSKSLECGRSSLNRQMAALERSAFEWNHLGECSAHTPPIVWGDAWVYVVQAAEAPEISCSPRFTSTLTFAFTLCQKTTTLTMFIFESTNICFLAKDICGQRGWAVHW